MFNFKNRFQYIQEPIDGGGGTGSGTNFEVITGGGGGGGGSTGGGGTTASIGTTYVSTTYNNLYFDLSGAESYTDYILYPDADFYGVKYYKRVKNSVTLIPPVQIRQTDIVVTNNNLYSWTVNDTPVCNIRRHWGIGKQEDAIDWFVLSGTQYLYSTDLATYLILQKAVPVTEYVTLNSSNGELISSIISSNSSTNITVGTNFKLKKNLSRGKEVSSSWSFLKTDPNGAFINQPAVINVDYELISGTSTSNEIIMKFITSFNFTIKQIVSGYTFNNNPFEIFANQLEGNTVTSSYFFNTTAFSFDTEIKFPKVETTLFVPALALLGSNPFKTYQNQPITITPTLDLTTSFWKQFPISNPSSITLLIKTLEEWKVEMNLRCNIILEVRDKETNALILTKEGLEPYTILLQDIKSFNLQIKTILR